MQQLQEKRVNSSHGAHGAGGSGVGSAVSKLLLAACAVGVGASFSAPIGGVIFALELMLPQTYDALALVLALGYRSHTGTVRPTTRS